MNARGPLRTTIIFSSSGWATPPPPPFIFLLGIEEDGTFVMFAPRVATNYGYAPGKKKKKSSSYATVGQTPCHVRYLLRRHKHAIKLIIFVFYLTN